MHLDTHVVIWLHEGEPDFFPLVARRLLDSEPLLISPMVRLELALLHEIGRMAPSPGTVLADLGRSVGLTVSPAPFAAVTAAATDLGWTRDPFDRLISAQAIVEDTVLLTKDRRIRQHLDRARWDDDQPSSS